MGVRAAKWLGLVLLVAAGAAFAAAVGSGSPLSSLLTTSGTTTTVPANPPGAPTLLSATAGAEGVTLTWTPPASDGGTTIFEYVIYRGTAVGQETAIEGVVGASSTQYVDRSTVQGTKYVYEIVADNGVLGPRSNVLAVTAAGPVLPQLFDSPYQHYAAPQAQEAAAIGDVTGDGRADVVVTSSYQGDPLTDFHLFVYAQNADGTLAAPVSYATAGAYSTRPTSVAVGDITGDGRNDVVVGIDSVGVQVFPQTTSGTLGAPTTTATADALRIRLGKLNGDTKLDVVGVGWGTNTVGVLLNNGAGGLAPPITYTAPHGGYDDLEVGDVTGDGRTDIVVMSGQLYADPNISVLPQLAGGGFGSAASYRVGTNVLTDGIGVGDVNGDGRADVVATDNFDRTLAVFAQTTLGTLGGPITYPLPQSAGPVDVADLNGDGRPDVVTTANSYAGVLRQRADGTLSAEELYDAPFGSTFNGHALAVGDVTGDGAPDVVGATNSYGLVVLRNASPAAGATAPGAPTLTSVDAGKASVTLHWAPPSSNGGAPITGYRIYRGTTSGGEAFLGTLSQPTATSFTDEGLSAATTYYYEVSAVNAVGESHPSNELSATPSDATVPDAPNLIEANSGYDLVYLDWNAPASNGGASITGYRIYRGTAAGAETLLDTVSAGSTAYPDYGALGGTTYYYTVTAVNSVGESSPSNERSAIPLTPHVPDPPTLAASATFSKVHLTWTTGSSGGPSISGYKLYRGTTSGGETLLATIAYNTTYYDDTSGVNGTTYYYELTALNSVGESAFSNELSATPVAPSPPSAPNLRQATAGYSSVTLNWDTPTSNGGASISGYRVYRGTASGAETPLVTLGTVTTYTDTSGANGTFYYYVIKALNAAGESLPSNEMSAVPVRRLFDPYQAYPVVGSSPLAAAIGDVTGDGRNDVVIVTGYASAPAYNGVLVYAQRADGTLAPPVSYPAAGGPSSVAVGDITGDGRADVVVGVDGTGVQVFPQTPAGTLGTPTLTPYSGVRLIRLGQLDGDGRLDVASADGSSIAVFVNNGLGGLKQPVTIPVAAGDLEVSDVTGDGRDDLVGLVGQNVSVSPQLAGGGFAAPATYPTNANAWGVGGIGAGDVTGDGRNDVVVSYGGNFPNSFITVLAQSANGTLGTPVAYATYDIPQPVDTADFDIDGLTDVALLHGAFAAAGVHRQRPGGTLFPEERYAIPYVNPYREHALALGDFTGDGTPDIAIADFNNGLIVLRNLTAPTRAPAVPALTAATADKAAINLTWSAPPTAGGAPSGYRVYRGTASGNETLLATLGTATSFADNTAVPGTTYWYQVSAVNSRGEGARSNERSSAMPNPDATAPTTPGSLTLVVAGTSQLALDWSPSTDNVGVIGYRVYRNNALVVTATTTQFLDSGLAAGANYSYKVTAVDAAGNESPSSSSITAKTIALAKGTTGTLAGVVYDAAGKPLANAVVGLAGKTMRTSATGLWKLSNLKAASYSVTVSLGGYRSQTFTVAAVAGKTVLAVTALSP